MGFWGKTKGNFKEIEDITHRYGPSADRLHEDISPIAEKWGEVRDARDVLRYEKLFLHAKEGATKILDFFKTNFSDFLPIDIGHIEREFADNVLDKIDVYLLNRYSSFFLLIYNNCTKYGFLESEGMKHPSSLKEGKFEEAGCGARAVWALLTLRIGKVSEKGIKWIQEQTDPTFYGTLPGNITKALQNSGGKKVTMSHYPKKETYLQKAADNIPCITKIAVSTLYQHYVCLTHVERDKKGAPKIFSTNDGLLIPAEYLFECSTKGHIGANIIWTI